MVKDWSQLRYMLLVLETVSFNSFFRLHHFFRRLYGGSRVVGAGGWAVVFASVFLSRRSLFVGRMLLFDVAGKRCILQLRLPGPVPGMGSPLVHVRLPHASGTRSWHPLRESNCCW